MIRRFTGPFLIVVLLSAMSLLAQTPSQFSADIKITSRQMTGAGKLYVGGTRVRMEMGLPDNQKTTIITDNDRKIAYMLMPGNMYMEMSTEGKAAKKQGPQYRMYNPANPCADSADMTCKQIGTGIADGRLCNKWLFTDKKGRSDMTVWIDQKSGIPIKTEMTDGTKLELLNIKEGPQSSSLFQVPAGYKKFGLGNMLRNLPKGDE
jgi:hypothetical protein